MTEILPEHQAVIDAAVRFCRDIDPAEVLRRDGAHIAPYDFLPRLGELGFIRGPIPIEHGGLGLPWTVFSRVIETFGYYAQPVGSVMDRAICFGALPLIMHGSDSQRAGFLPDLLDGNALMALALSEPGAGSDARALSTRATPADGGWRINGRKTWISDADHADQLLTPCRLAGVDSRTFVTFMVPRHAEGIAMTLLPKVGNNCMPSFDIGYDDVFVSDDARLGPVGGGFDVISSTLKYSRTSLAALLIGAGQAVIDLAASHARERVQFKQPIATFQVIRHRLVDMALEHAKARHIVYAFARAVDAGEDVDALGAMAKIAATEMFQYVTNHGMQILASAGYALDSPMQMHWRNARLYSIGEGANEIQREIIAHDMGLFLK